MKVSGKNTQERHVFLFNDMIIYAKPAVLSKNKYMFKGVIPLHEAKFETYKDATLENAIKITRNDNGKTYFLFDDTDEEDVGEWLSDIQGAVDDGASGAPAGENVVVGAFHMAETSPDARRDAVVMTSVETRISGWSNENPQRRFIASGPLKYVAAGSSDSSSDIEHKGCLFLFNDIVVLTRQVKNNQARVPFQHRETFELEAATAQDVDLVDLDGDRTPYYGFILAVKNRRVVLLFPTVEEKDRWYSLIGPNVVETASAMVDQAVTLTSGGMGARTPSAGQLAATDPSSAVAVSSIAAVPPGSPAQVPLPTHPLQLQLQLQPPARNKFGVTDQRQLFSARA